ncbi:MAG: hypothetical protein J5845_08740 [Lachnospiraceae bacterium]|nr:hypothetical protein [Lachnospiraceae bacterium]
MRNIVTGIMVVVVIGLAAFGFYMVTQKMKDMKGGFSNKKSDRNASKEAYLEKAENLLGDLEQASAIAQSQCALLEEVWTNVTSKKSSADTDRYTKDENGEFFTDYAEALDRLRNDEEFDARQKQLAEAEAALMEKFNNIDDVPVECKVMHTSLKECCTALSDLTAYTAGGRDSSVYMYHSEWTGAKSKFDASVSVFRFAADNMRKVMDFGNR